MPAELTEWDEALAVAAASFDRSPAEPWWPSRGEAPVRREAAVRPAVAPERLSAARGLLGGAFAWVPPPGDPAPPAGFALAVKELIAVAGAPHGDGSAAPGATAAADAPAVAALLAAGGGLVGTTSSTELALGVLDAEHAPTENPAHPELVVGGSSTGSAAAVAAGVADLALGTDTGGSVRIPAAWTATVGFKPTWGAIPTAGVVPLAWSLDHVGLIGPTVADVAAGFAGAAGREEAPPPAGDASLGLVELEGVVELSAPIAAGFEAAVAVLRDAGLELEGVGCGPWRDPELTHLAILLCEMAAAHGGRTEPLTPRVAAALAAGERAPATLYLRAAGERRLLLEQLEAQLERHDAVLTPTVPCGPPRRLDPGQEAEDAAVRLTSVANLAGAPAISLPFGGPPGFALQLVGRPGEDDRLLAIAQRLELLRPPDPAARPRPARPAPG